MKSLTRISNLLQQNTVVALFKRIYAADEATLKLQHARYAGLTESFINKFGDADDFFLFSTPGRTEIGGNHTDHNAGRVLAGSVNLDAIAIATPKSEQTVTLFSEGFDKPFQIDLANLEPREDEKETTQALIRGVAAKFVREGYAIGGLNICMTCDVLVGSGLSSSATIEVLLGTIWNRVYNQGKISRVDLAKFGQYAENHYFGKPCGLMDQIACAFGGIVAIDFADVNNPEVNRVRFDFAAQHYSVVVVDTGGSHADLTAHYAAIPIEMFTVAKFFGKEKLRDVPRSDFFQNMKALRAVVGDRAVLRALHFLNENERVVAQLHALENDDFAGFLKLVNASGNSSWKQLQNVTAGVLATAQSVTLALSLSEDFIHEIGEGACRVHGGGFAGTIQAFIPNAQLAAYEEKMEAVFGEESLKILSIRPAGTIEVKLD